jgi:RNA polymerase sigma factor (sigma-70 family)
MLLFVVHSYMGFDSDDIWHDIPVINITNDSIPTDDSIFRINLDTFVGCWESFSSMSTAQKRDRLSQIFNIDYFDSATVLTNADSLEKLKKSGFYDRSPADQNGFIYIYTFEDNVLAGLYEQGFFWWKNRRYETKLKIGRTEQNVFRRINQQFDNKTGISEPPILLAVFWTKLVVQCEREIHNELTDKRLKDKEGNLAKGGVEWFKDTPTQILPTVLKWVEHCNIIEKINKIKEVQRVLSLSTGRSPRLEEVARAMDMTLIQLQEMLMRVLRSVSLNVKVDRNWDTELGDMIEADNVTPEQMMMRESLQGELVILLADLTDRERDVICLRFGLGYNHPHSLADIGRLLDVTRERVRQIEAKALQKLRQPKRRNRVRDYLESMN